MFILFILAISAVVSFFALRSKKTNATQIVASFFPVTEFVHGVAGEKYEIRTIIPDGVSEHEFEPAAKDIAGIFSSKIFFINGFGIEPWAERLKPELEASGIKVVDLSAVAIPLPDSKTPNPHIWLDPLIAEKEIGLVSDSLSNVFPENAEYFRANAEKYKSEISKIDGEYSFGLKKCRLRQAIVSHDAFPYLGKRYNIEFLPILGESEEDEPGLKEIARLTDKIKKENMKFVFYEYLESPKPAEILSQETGASILPLDSICGLSPETKAAGDDYFSIFRKNLINIRKALECQ